MGRSVFTQSDAVSVVYLYLSSGEDCTREDWEDFIDGLRYTVTSAFPSFDEAEEWVDRESKAILSNDHARVIVAEYCGLVSLCLCPNPRAENYGTEGLALAWSQRIANRFASLFNGPGYLRLNKLGTFSNGEAVFERVGKEEA